MDKVLKENYEDLGFAKLDLSRENRTGTSEAIFCAGKTPQQLLDILRTFKRNLLPLPSSLKLFLIVK